jgi:hypothetical protein
MPKSICLSIILISLFGCAAEPQPVPVGDTLRQQNQGYSLLYQLMRDESDVGKIFLFKHADDSVGNLVREIGHFCQAAKKQMDDFQKADNNLIYITPDLPPIEQQGRDLQKDDDTKALLFSSGKDFELRILFTQAQAMNYATQLSRALASNESNAARKSFLENMTKQTRDYHDRLMKLLAPQS